MRTNCKDIQSSLSRMIELLESQMEIVNTCMVDFISMDLFKQLSPSMQEELLSLEEETLVLLPALLHDQGLELPSSCPLLSSVISELRDCKLEHLGLLTELPQSLSDDSELTSLSNWDKIMPPKKTHEVDLMSRFISNCLSDQHGVTSIVDLGSGKAYLSHVLNSLYDIPVLAIDGKTSNTRGAELRNRNLQSKWGILSARASDRARGETPTNRKSRAKNTGESRSVGPAPLSEASMVTITKFVEDSSDLRPLVEQHLPGKSERLGIVGLHTCGDLASSSVMTFIHTEKARFLCNVGCCYNHLTSEGFPLSSYLRQRQFKLPQNLLKLGVQPLVRLASNATMPSISLLWRSILEVILNNREVDGDSRNVGRIASKCEDFLQYIRKAESKLNFNSNLTDEEVESFYSEHRESYMKKLVSFYQYKALFSLMIESIILTDRLLFLKENQIEDSSIVKLFDSNISPRSYAIVAYK